MGKTMVFCVLNTSFWFNLWNIPSCKNRAPVLSYKYKEVIPMYR